MVVNLRLLHTGFLPFGGDTSNPSGDAARVLGARGKLEIPGPSGLTIAVQITARVFDVLWSMPADGTLPSQSGAADDVERAIDDLYPDIVISTGMAADKFRVERQAEDRDGSATYISPDNHGRAPQLGRREFPAEPLHRPTTLPFEKIEKAWTKASITNFTASFSAGNFICEDVFYRVLRCAADPARQARGMRIHRAGFIHVPGPSYTTTEKVVKGLEIAIRETVLDIPVDAYFPYIDSPLPQDLRRGRDLPGRIERG